MDDGWLRAGTDNSVTADLADLANRRGTTGATADLVVRHRDQRVDYEEYVAAARRERQRRQDESMWTTVDAETGEIRRRLTLIEWHPPGWVDRRPGRAA